jgi:hypothetical protein
MQFYEMVEPGVSVSDRSGENRFSLSLSIAVYRVQAGFTDGISDGKSSTTRHKVISIQMLMSAGDNWVGVTTALPYCCTVGRGGEFGDLGRNWQLLDSGRSRRFRESVL